MFFLNKNHIVPLRRHEDTPFIRRVEQSHPHGIHSKGSLPKRSKDDENKLQPLHRFRTKRSR